MALTFAQLDVDIFADPKVRRLMFATSDPIRFYACMGAYVEVLTLSWANEEPAAVSDTAVPTELHQPLIDAGMLDQDGRLPREAFMRRLQPVIERRDGSRRRMAAKRERDGALRVGDGALRVTNASRPLPLPSRLPSGEGESEGEDPLPALQWLAANVTYVDRFDGLGRMVAERVTALGNDEVVRRLEVIHSSGDVDPGDAFGYITGITDRFRRKPKPRTEDDEVEEAIKRRRKRS